MLVDFTNGQYTMLMQQNYGMAIAVHALPISSWILPNGSHIFCGRYRV